MKTIVITSQKGGSGKSTLTALLSVEAERAGDGPAWLIDTDEQGTLTRWHQRRKSAETPQLFDVPFARLDAGIDILAGQHGARFCFIDTPPTISVQNKATIARADLVLVPVLPSPNDLWAVAETVDIVKEQAKPFRFVIMKAKPQANLTGQTAAALSHSGPVARQFISDRVAYAAAITSGHTAPELAPRGSAAVEVEALWREVKECFAESSKARKKVSHG